jgi:serine/alanine adding enzyme
VNYQPFLFSVINEHSKKIEALFLVTQIKIFRDILSKFSTRMVSYGGIIHRANDNQGLLKLFEFYDQLFQNKCLFTEIRNMQNTDLFKPAMITAGYEYGEYLNYIIEIKKDVQSIFRSFSESRRRNIRALEKMGVYVEEMTEMKDVETVYKVLTQTYSRIQIPLADISLFEALMKHLYKKNMAKFYLAKLKDQVLASLVILLYKDVIYTWYHGSVPESYTLSPESLLIWHVIKWGALNGYQRLDFGGAGRPDEDYGVRDFKARFKGECVNYGRYLKVYSNTRLRLSKLGYQLYRKLL